MRVSVIHDRALLALLSLLLCLPTVSDPAQGQASLATLSTSRRRFMHDPNVKEEYKKWLKEDVAWIITDEEMADFVNLSTDQQRDEFVAAFWARRNPNPGSPENAFKEEHYRRIACANEKFAAGVIPGWKTDRGRIYIMYGAPDWVSYFPPASDPDNPTEILPQYEVWHYAYIKDIGLNVALTFTDACWCDNNRLSEGISDPLELLIPDFLGLFWLR